MAAKHVSLLVIGGGITGLSTALTWALNNSVTDKPVMLIEKNPVVGGYVTSFKRKGFLFDTVQIIPECSDLLEFFGVDIPLRKFEGYYARIFLTNADTGKTRIIHIPSGVNEFKNSLLKKYPSQKKQIDSFFKYSLDLFNELKHLKVEPGFFELMKIAMHCPKIVGNSKKTFLEYIKKFKFSEPDIFEIFDVFSAFSGLPAERVSALLPVSAMITSLRGAYRPQKGFIKFPSILKRRIEELGGQVVTNTAVKKIIIKDNKAIGVCFENDAIVYADNIVTTIDPNVALKEMVGTEHINNLSKKYAKKLGKIKMSPSAFHISLGLDEKIDLKRAGFDCGYNLLTTGKGTYNKLFSAFDNDELLQSDKCFFIPVICPSLTIGGKQTLIILVYPAPIQNWVELREKDKKAYTEKKEQIASFYIRTIEKYMLPGLQNHIEFIDIGTPATFARFSGSPTGSKFDMSPYPDNFGRTRLKMRTPIKNLYQPKFSHGIWPGMQAGIQVVDMIMDRKIMNGNSRYTKQSE